MPVAVVFLLGPSQWLRKQALQEIPSPMEERRQIAQTLRHEGHRVVLMEDIHAQDREDLIAKFDRILQCEGVTDILVYWPPQAKMQTTYDELILLSDRCKEPNLPRVWVLHQSSLAEISRNHFQVNEAGGRSRYLEAVARLGVRPLDWETRDDMMRLVRLLATEL